MDVSKERAGIFLGPAAWLVAVFYWPFFYFAIGLILIFGGGLFRPIPPAPKLFSVSDAAAGKKPEATWTTIVGGKLFWPLAYENSDHIVLVPVVSEEVSARWEDELRRGEKPKLKEAGAFYYLSLGNVRGEYPGVVEGGWKSLTAANVTGMVQVQPFEASIARELGKKSDTSNLAAVLHLDSLEFDPPGIAHMFTLIGLVAVLWGFRRRRWWTGWMSVRDYAKKRGTIDAKMAEWMFFLFKRWEVEHFALEKRLYVSSNPIGYVQALFTGRHIGPGGDQDT